MKASKIRWSRCENWFPKHFLILNRLKSLCHFGIKASLLPYTILHGLIIFSFLLTYRRDTNTSQILMKLRNRACYSHIVILVLKLSLILRCGQQCLQGCLKLRKNKQTNKNKFDCSLLLLWYVNFRYTWYYEAGILITVAWGEGVARLSTSGGQETYISSFVLIFLLFSPHFSSIFLHFLPQFGRLGGQHDHPGRLWLCHWWGPHLASHYSLVLVQRNTLGYSIHLTLTHLSLIYFWPFLTCQIIENNCHKVCCAEVTLLESSDQY